MAVDYQEPRFVDPICTIREVALLVGMPLDTVKAWSGQRRSRPPFITRIPQGHRGWPSIPLVGLAEASALRALRAVLPHGEVAAAAEWIRSEFGSPHALANRRLVTDGAYAYVQEHGDQELLYRVKTQQHVIAEVVAEHLRPLRFEGDDYPTAFRVAAVEGAEIDPRYNSGRMAFERNRVPLFAVVGLLKAGEPATIVAQEFGLSMSEVASVEHNVEWLDEAA